MPRAVRLRPWQADALQQLVAHPGQDFLAVATPGAGKTRFALAAALDDLARSGRRRVVVVAPTTHLKRQWAEAAAELGLHLDHAWTARDGDLSPDVHGAVVTYQQVAGSATEVRRVARDAFAVLDEIHHAGDEHAWGDGLRVAFETAGRRLALSGTPFRSDTTPIPFVRYVDQQAEPDYAYDYGRALCDGGVVRPVYFPATDGAMEWRAPDGAVRAHTFADRIDAVAAGQRLRTALAVDGEWLPAVLARAHAQLQAVRAVQPDAGGLVIAADQEHARGIAALLGARHGVRATVVTSDDPSASARISRFGASADEWIVAVRMVSEGVDIPRLRVGVFATTITTELFFRQAVGRLVRWTRGRRRQPAYLYIPDELRLRSHARAIAEQRTHSLRRRASDEDAPPRPERAVADAGQASLFAVISAVALDPAEPFHDGDDDPEPAEEAAQVTVTLDAPPLLAPAAAAGPGAAPTGTLRDHKAELREANAARVRLLALRTRRTHAQVNGELNRLVAIRGISQATVAQLEARIRHADALLRRV